MPEFWKQHEENWGNSNVVEMSVQSYLINCTEKHKSVGTIMMDQITERSSYIGRFVWIQNIPITTLTAECERYAHSSVKYKECFYITIFITTVYEFITNLAIFILQHYIGNSVPHG